MTADLEPLERLEEIELDEKDSMRVVKVGKNLSKNTR